MRDQYAGDISDLLKFCFLRALAGADRTLGMAWYYVPGDDGRQDGRHLEWREEGAWMGLDRDLHRGLSGLAERSVAALEQATIWPKNVIFHREPVPISRERSDWADRKRAVLEAADIVFLDPDNGLGRKTPKHATLSELRLLRRPGRSLAFITFPGRSAPHDFLLQQLHQKLTDDAGAKGVTTVRTSVAVPSLTRPGSFVPRQRWFTVVDPDSVLIERTRAFAEALAAIPRVRVRVDASVDGCHGMNAAARSTLGAASRSTGGGEIAMPSSKDFGRELREQIKRATNQRRPHIEVNAGELHRAVGGYPPKVGQSHRMPLCCEIMWNAFDHRSDDVIFRPDSGQGASLTIRYRLPRFDTDC